MVPPQNKIETKLKKKIREETTDHGRTQPERIAHGKDQQEHTKDCQG